MMPRTAVCVICAMLASIAAALLLLMPSPLIAQDAAKELKSDITIGQPVEEGAAAKVVVATLKMLGGEEPVAGFKLLALLKREDKPHLRQECITGEDGRLTIRFYGSPAELRVFAFGEYVIPDAWSNIPIGRMKFEGPESWELRVRTLADVRVSGVITLADIETAPKRANVSFAPLDVAQDGSSRLFDAPISVLTDDAGRYEVILPTGYYQVWSYWTDRTSDDWIGYVRVQNKLPIFKDTRIDLALQKGPQLKGRVVDARTGEGIGADIDLYSNVYLRQLRNTSANGTYPDAYDEEDKPIFWPVGTFNFRAWSVDPDDFTVVIKPQGMDAVTKVIPNQSAAKLAGKEIVWTLFGEDMQELTLKVMTHEQDLPVMDTDLRLIPRNVEVPEHIRQSYMAGASTDAGGVARFLGLARGTYEVFAEDGVVLLGEITVTGEPKQQIDLKFPLAFAYGNINLADGSVCKNMVVFVRIVRQDEREFGPYSNDAFRGNPILQERGTILVPLGQEGTTFKLQFAAMENGRAIRDEEWVKVENFPLVTDEIAFKIDGERGYKVDLQLKPNADYKPLKD